MDGRVDSRVLLGLSAGVLSAVFLYKTLTKKKYKLPPGPAPWPIVGNILELRHHPRVFEHFVEMGKTYGDIFTVHIGNSPTVVLNSLDAIREALVTKQNDFAGRPHSFTIDYTSLNRTDIAFGDFTPVWKAQRKITHNAIRKFAEKTKLEEFINTAFESVTEEFLKQTGPFNPQDHMTLLIYNIICSMCFGKTYKFDDEEFVTFYKTIDETNLEFSNGVAADYIPLLRFFPTPAIRKIKRIMNFFIDWFKKVMDEHRESFDPENLRDFTDMLILEGQSENDGGVHLEEDHYLGVLIDMFFAGTDTSRITLTWVIQYMARYTDVQDKLYQEIEKAVGSQTIGLKHRASLPYTYAVLHEVMRVRPIAPAAIPHETTCDTSVGGYDLPAGTQVLVNLWAVHHSSKHWTDPEVFRPERFLDEHGQVAPYQEGFLPFSAGRRVCVGESLAKTELHILVAKLFQRFKFEAVPNHPLTGAMEEISLACMPSDFKITVKVRG